VRLVRRKFPLGGGDEVKESVVRELRAVQRYGVRLPVRVTCRTPGAPDSCLNGFTRDVSTRGMFIIADAGAPDSDVVEFELDLAFDEITPLIVQGKGRVVRTEHTPGQRAGFAVYHLSFRFREADPGGALPRDLESFAGAPFPVPISFRKSGHHQRLAVVPPRFRKDSDQGE
jgi:hypothetical protein